MGKRKNKGNGAQHQTQSFQQLVANATLAKFSDYIDHQVQNLGRALVQRQAQSVQNLVLRMTALEEVIIELNPTVTKEDLATKVAAITDRFEDFSAVDGPAELGDRVRVELRTRTEDQKEFQGSSRLQVEEVGSNKTLGSELEQAMLGMKAGETKEIKFGKDGSMVASITMNRVSRSNAPVLESKAEEQELTAEEVTETAQAEAPAPTQATEEVQNANAG